MVWLALGEYRGPMRLGTFLHYLRARYNSAIIEASYRYYVTDSLRLVPQGMYFTTKWRDLVEGRGIGPERTAEEIIDDVIARLES